MLPGFVAIMALSILYAVYHDTMLIGALFFGLNTPVLFYGRYGSSIAGTLLAVLLAFYATWLFLESGRHTVLKAIFCGAGRSFSARCAIIGSTMLASAMSSKRSSRFSLFSK